MRTNVVVALIAVAGMTTPGLAANTLELNCACTHYVHQIASYDSYADGRMTVSTETLPFDENQCKASNDSVVVDLDASTITSVSGSGPYSFHAALESSQPATISDTRISASGTRSSNWTIDIDRASGRYKFELRIASAPQFLMSVDGICEKAEPNR